MALERDEKTLPSQSSDAMFVHPFLQRYINVKDTLIVRKIISPWKLINTYQWAIIYLTLQNL